MIMPNFNRKHSRQAVFDFIVAYKRAHDGNSPTLRQIMDARGISSTSVAHNILHGLERSGFIRILPGSQGIVVIGGCWSVSSSSSSPNLSSNWGRTGGGDGL